MGIKNMRSMYVPHREGNTLIQADLKNGEGRVVAVLSRSETLAQIFREERDVHGEVATAFFGPDWTYEQRTKAKGIVHGLNYGRTAHGIASDPEFGLTVPEVEVLIEKYWEMAPEVKEWQLAVYDKVFRTDQDLTSVFGRRRRFMLITPDNEHEIYKEALAWEPQSVSSDICLFAACTLVEEGFAVRNIVHDSILIEASESEAVGVGKYMCEVMERTGKEEFTDKVDFYIPFETEFEIGPNWGQMKEYKDAA